MVLEGAAARLAARPAAELGPLEEAYRAMEQASDFARFVEADALFHRRVAEVGGNRLLVVILTALRDPIVRLITAGLSGDDRGPGPGEDLPHPRGDPQGDPLSGRRRGRSPFAASSLRSVRRDWSRPRSGARWSRC